jgi:hypothetical protein
MNAIKYVLVFLLLVQVTSAPRPAGKAPQSQPAPCQPSELNQYDAEILLYLLPASVTVRGNGKKVGWELQRNPVLNQKDFYVFYLYDLGAPDHGSPTIGYFAVNKHTAEVWHMDMEEFVESEDLLAVQRILRKGHCVDDTVLKTYSPRRPEIPSK